jgi:hypothetical protein
MLSLFVVKINTDRNQASAFGEQFCDCLFDFCLQSIDFGNESTVGRFLELGFDAAYDRNNAGFVPKQVEQEFSGTRLGQSKLSSCVNSAEMIQELFASRKLEQPIVCGRLLDANMPIEWKCHYGFKHCRIGLSNERLQSPELARVVSI